MLRQRERVRLGGVNKLFRKGITALSNEGKEKQVRIHGLRLSPLIIFFFIPRFRLAKKKTALPLDRATDGRTDGRMDRDTLP